MGSEALRRPAQSLASLAAYLKLGCCGAPCERLDRGRSVLRPERLSHHKHLLARLDGPGGLAVGPYLAKRALRIVPAYYAVLLFVAAGLVPLYPMPQDALALRLGYHALFLQDYLPANIVVVFWSLGVEEKFYFLAPLILMAVMSLRPEARLAAVGCLVS